jgi:hypothetical protein
LVIELDDAVDDGGAVRAEDRVVGDLTVDEEPDEALAVVEMPTDEDVEGVFRVDED